jgi:hypothetical protein
MWFGRSELNLRKVRTRSAAIDLAIVTGISPNAIVKPYGFVRRKHRRNPTAHINLCSVAHQPAAPMTGHVRNKSKGVAKSHYDFMA